MNPLLCQTIADLFAQRWSPQQIARHLHVKHSDDRSMRLCHESIYQAVYQGRFATWAQHLVGDA